MVGFTARSTLVSTQLPDEPPMVYVSGLGPHSTELAAEIGDGFVTFSRESLHQYRRDGGNGEAQTATQGLL